MSTSKKSSKKKTLPLKKYPILGCVYTIKFSDDERFAGRCHKDKKIIELHPDQDTLEMFKTLIHELTHGLLHESKLDRVINSEIEELICYHFEEFFGEFITRLQKPKG